MAAAPFVVGAELKARMNSNLQQQRKDGKSMSVERFLPENSISNICYSVGITCDGR
jgi:hypothetical protein